MKNIKTIALVAPSGNIRNYDDLNKKIEVLKARFDVKKYYSEDSQNGYLSDTDKNRALYLQKAFLDDDVDLVISIRGGYGAIRIADLLDYGKLKNLKNKIYCGSSDATILLCALSKNTKINCFHSLMITNGFVENLDKNIDIISNEKFELDFKTINKGLLKGKLWGGNLSSLSSTFSDDDIFIPDEDIVLFIEDLNEPLYKIDKMMYEIYRHKKLMKKIKGVVFGDFYLEENEYSKLITEFSNLFNVPSICTNEITHKINNVTLPFMKQVEITAN